MNDYSNFIGKILDKRYKILELVGVGGMACVLRAQDLVMNRTVAIKILNDEYNGNEQAESRFIDESKAVAMLSHKNIVSIYDVAIYPDIKYIVMEYLDGITLREYLDNKGALPWNEACIYILQVLRALEHAHSKGVIHRDIKPQNIILQKNGEIKVMDFGIAKIPTSVSMAGDKAVGTVYYISPEQASGKETGSYSDLYSVGILLYEAVTGTLPFKANSPMAVAAMQVNDEPQNPRDLVLSIPVGVSQIILKAMMKNPSDRFRSAHSMAKAIEWVLRNPDVIFSLSGEDTSTIGDTSVISIDMIDTAEIKPYGEDEIAQSLGNKTISDKEMEQQKKKQIEEKKKKRASKKKRKPGKRSTTVFPVIAGIFFPFMIVAVILFVMLMSTFLKNTFFTDNDTTTAAFPNLIGKTYNEELISQLENGAFGSTFLIKEDAIHYSYNPDFKNGQIISTIPEAKTLKPATLVNGREVFYFERINVNRVETITTVPDVIGYSKNDAKIFLVNECGVNPKHILFEPDTSASDSTWGDGQICRTYPEAGDAYTVDEDIILYYCVRSVSDKTSEMPDCIGLEVEYAARLCRYALYTVEFIDVPSIGGDNKVIEQSIKAGTSGEDAGTVVTLTVSRPMEALQDLRDTKLVDAKVLLDSMGISYSVETYDLYDALYTDEKNTLLSATSYDDLLERLTVRGATIAFTWTEDSIVIFQSVPAGSLPTAEAPLVLVCINPIPFA